MVPRVQIFTKALDEVRRLEAKEVTPLWAVLKGMETWRSEEQVIERARPGDGHGIPGMGLLRWVRNADTRQGARWRASRFLEFARELAGESALLEPVRKALNTFQEHLPRILRRWDSLLSNARLEGLNGIFQAAGSRARGYRNVTTFITMIYLVEAPIADLQ